METPLTRQTRPDTFEPKIVELYRHLFHVLPKDDFEEALPSEGFWREVFLLKPEKERLFNILEPLSANELLQIQTHTRLFFRKIVEEAGSGISPKNENALESLTGFLCAVLIKRYTNPSTDVIEVLAGLDNIDRLVSDLVSGLEAIIRQSSNASFRQKAVNAALAMVAGSYQTTLVTYFIHRDLFPALVKFAHECPDSGSQVLILLGLLANYNKFESQNLYQNRLEDFVNEKTISSLAKDYAHTSRLVRDQYISIQDDAPTSWTLSSTLNMVGLRSLTPEAKKPTPPSEEEAKVLFNECPPTGASILMAAYTFVQANKIFASNLVSSSTAPDSKESPLSVYLSTTSYLCHHAHHSSRSHTYATLSLLILRLLAEDTIIMKRLSSSENKVAVRLARQRQPLLPHITGLRVATTVIIDICADTILHNLRKRLDIPLYNLSLSILLRTISHLESTKTRLQHHWSHTWSSLFSLLRFLGQYKTDLSTSSTAYQLRNEVCTPLTSLLAYCLSKGDNFLPDPASYDDLFYKIIESGAILPKFKAAYCPKSNTNSTANSSSVSALAKAQSAGFSVNTNQDDMLLVSTNALLTVATHYETLLTSKSKTHQSPATVQKLIREGYETLPDIGSPLVSSTVDAQNGVGVATRVIDFGRWEKWRESTWKSEIKRISRVVVEDARNIALQ